MAADKILNEVAPKRRQKVTYTCGWHNRLTIYITPTSNIFALADFQIFPKLTQGINKLHVMIKGSNNNTTLYHVDQGEMTDLELIY